MDRRDLQRRFVALQSQFMIVPSGFRASALVGKPCKQCAGTEPPLDGCVMQQFAEMQQIRQAPLAVLVAKRFRADVFLLKHAPKHRDEAFVPPNVMVLL